MGLFGPTRPLGRDELEWQLAGFQWVLAEFGGLAAHRETVLANPDGDYFADSKLTGHARAEELFAEVKALAGLELWPTRLVATAPQRGRGQVGDYISLMPETPTIAAGTFEMVEEEGEWLAVLRYDADLLKEPARLVGTLAHELAHYRLAYSSHSFPGGEAMHELLTDLTAVAMGFGLFLANNARSYSATNLDIGGHKWESGWQGYLSERALVTALVISETLAGRDPKEARPYLKPYLAQDLDLAIKYFSRRDVLADVMAIDLADFGVEPLTDG